MIVAHEEIGRKYADDAETATALVLKELGKRFRGVMNVTAAYETAKGFKVIVRIGGRS